MSKKKIERAKKSRIFPKEYLNGYIDDLDLINQEREQELERVKKDIKNNFSASDGEIDFVMFFS